MRTDTPEIPEVHDDDIMTTVTVMDDEGIETKWAVNEHIAVLYEVSSTKYVADAEITAVDGSGTATITFTVDGVSIDDTNPLVIKDNESNTTITTVTPASTATSVYAAMPAADSKAYKFVVTTADNKYIKSGTAAIEAGKYYQTTLSMSPRYPLALSSARLLTYPISTTKEGGAERHNSRTEPPSFF